MVELLEPLSARLVTPPYELADVRHWDLEADQPGLRLGQQPLEASGQLVRGTAEHVERTSVVHAVAEDHNIVFGPIRLPAGDLDVVVAEMVQLGLDQSLPSPLVRCVSLRDGFHQPVDADTQRCVNAEPNEGPHSYSLLASFSACLTVTRLSFLTPLQPHSPSEAML